MRTALQRPAAVVCLQLDRFRRSHDGQVTKVTAQLLVDGPCQIPILAEDNTPACSLTYEVIVGVIHQGWEERGHYQALLRVGTAGEVERPNDFTWLLTDDGCQTRLLTGWIARMARQASILWLVRQDLVDIPPAPQPVMYESERQKLLDMMP